MTHHPEDLPRPTLGGANPVRWLGLLILGGLAGAVGCTDSRLDPAGLRQAHKAAREALPDGDEKSPRVAPRARARAQPRTPPRPRPPKGPLIPTPPFRLDVRVDPAGLALLPPGAAAVVALRPDLPGLLARILGSHGKSLQQLDALKWLGPELLTRSLATPLGLREDRAILVALLAKVGYTDPLKNHLEGLVPKPAPKGARMRPKPGLRAALAPARLPELSLQIRVVARVKDAARTRKGLAELAARAAKAGHGALRLTSDPALPAPLKGLSSQGVVAVGYGPSGTHGWTLQGDRLLLDVLLRVSGAWTPGRAARELAGMLKPYKTPTRFSPAERIILQSSADLALVLRAPVLAEAARWLGVGQLLPALGHIKDDNLPRLLTLGWRVAGIPAAFQSVTPRAVEGFGLRLYLPGRPQLRLTWQLTHLGMKLVGDPTAKVAGRDLRRDNGLVDQWLKPMAARVPKTLPAKGPFTAPDLARQLADGGILMWPLALAELWPRFIAAKPVRKRVLKVLRKKLRPGRFVGRINVRQQGSLLELVLEGHPPNPAPAPAK